jgi:hypothetical protein
VKTSDLKFSGFDGIPEHMAQLGEIAKSLGLSRGALLRLLIAQYLRRESRKQK